MREFTGRSGSDRTEIAKSKLFWRARERTLRPMAQGNCSIARAKVFLVEVDCMPVESDSGTARKERVRFSEAKTAREFD